MSGPKCGEYNVVSAAEIRRRQMRAARDRMDRLEQRRSALAAEIHAHVRSGAATSLAVPAIVRPANDDPAEWNRVADAMDATLSKCKAAFDIERVSAQLSRNLHLLPTPTSSIASWGFRDVVVTAAPVHDREALRERLTRLVSRLPSDTTPAEMTRCDELIEAALQSAGASSAEVVLEHLRHQVETVNQRSEGIRSATQRVEHWFGQLDGLEGQDVEDLRRRLEGLSVENLPDLSAEVDRVSSESRRRQDADFTLVALRESLKELEYDVGDSFETLLADSKGAVMPLPSGSDHGVRVRHRDGQLLFHVVRFDRTGRTRAVDDVAAERTFCDDFARLTDAMLDHGVDLRLTAHYAPGDKPVEVIRLEAPKSAAKTIATSKWDDDDEDRARPL